MLPNQITPVDAGVIYFLNLLSIPFLVKRNEENRAISLFISLRNVNNAIAASVLILALIAWLMTAIGLIYQLVKSMFLQGNKNESN